ncbi:MAG TPA: hypothetical protein VH186_10495 [Chloroflexia bacterium]|nr:hypothetical protein [Chloroflexia bacterium]
MDTKITASADTAEEISSENIETPATPAATTKKANGRGRLFLLAVVILGVTLALLIGQPWKSSKTVKPLLPDKMPTSAAIEAKWGIRISQIGVTADGGLIDFRFVVLDSEKATNMMKDVNNLPVLIASDSGKTVNSAALMPTKHDLNAGQTYFLLYRNTQGAIKHDTTISVVFQDDLRLDNAIVR